MLKRRLEADATDREAEFSLAQLLRAVTGCVSSLRERKHDALLSEVLGIRVWLMPRVGFGGRFGSRTAPARRQQSMQHRALA